MCALRVSIVTNAKEDTKTYTDRIFPSSMDVQLQKAVLVGSTVTRARSAR